MSPMSSPPGPTRYLDPVVSTAGRRPTATAPRQVVVRETRNSKFQQTVTVGPHRMLADEPVAAGGEDSGPGPYDFLLAGLGACTSMTMRLYADRKSLPLERVTVTLRHNKIHAEDCAECETKAGMLDQIDRVIAMEGTLDAEQRAKADGDRRQVPGASHPDLGSPHRDQARRIDEPSRGRIIGLEEPPMPAVARIDPKAVFSPEEWSRLTSRSSLRGMWLVAHAWGTIAAAIALVAVWPNPLTWLIAVMVVGHAPARACDPDARSRPWRAARQQGHQRMGRAMAVRGAGRRRSGQLSLLSFAASQIHPAAGRSQTCRCRRRFRSRKESYARKAVRDLTGQTFVKQRLPLFLSLFRRETTARMRRPMRASSPAAPTRCCAFWP